MTISKKLEKHIELELGLTTYATRVRWLAEKIEAYHNLCNRCNTKPPTEMHYIGNGDTDCSIEDYEDLCSACHRVYHEQDNCPYELPKDPYKDYENERPNYSKIKRQVTTSLSEDDWRTRYKEYLKSDEWKQKRNLVIRRCGGICEGCLSAKVTEVHHTTYDNVFDELLYQLIGLCRTCHARIHDLEK